MKLILKYFILIIFLVGCKNNADQAKEESLSLYKEPVVVPLNTSGGYIVNQLTGDSIKTLITASGETFKTGIPVPLISSIISNEILQPKTIKNFQKIKLIIKIMI